ncbi:MAG: hypothetical protein H6830_07315 [Planctomycetes bacterium]|nr:hypothetical protein [Planctomycetota bacterium]MCB9910208.1 hypothetical protein [Planctomycetota bacterium]HPF13532.1 DUF5522 domain-containing protein [Planctomycetota bacterium]HRV79935.1 DUF5522 domain-containing protein [Planctomycetota bacterium]
MSSPERKPLPEARRKPHPQRLSPQHPQYDAIVAAHEAAIERGQPMYVDPCSGLWVQTAATIWARGSCCDLGCRHCPYLGSG